jgi:KipI family sensor histidine kinase inhibitor
MDILPYGENGLRLVFGKEISLEINERVRRAYLYLRSLSLRSVVDIIPSFTTCLVVFDQTRATFDELADLLRRGQKEMAEAELPEPRLLEIPVSYGGQYGPDMDSVCDYSGLSGEEVVRRHTSAVYTVFTIGFLPGFPYLGPLDGSLFMPRLDTPRLKVAEGSVGIVQLQTGIYTFESPAGWRIIGRTGMKLFDPDRFPYSLLAMGDRVRFVSV